MEAIHKDFYVGAYLVVEPRAGRWILEVALGPQVTAEVFETRRELEERLKELSDEALEALEGVDGPLT